MVTNSGRVSIEKIFNSSNIKKLIMLSIELDSVHYDRISGVRLFFFICRMIFLFFYFSLNARIKSDSIIKKYLKQTNENTSSAKFDQIIYYSLAELSEKIEKTATLEEVKGSIKSQLDEILENLKISQKMIRIELNHLLQQINKTKSVVMDTFSEIRWQVHEGVDNMTELTNQTIDNLLISTFEKREEIERQYTEQVFLYPGFEYDIFAFLLFQAVFIIGVYYYRKLNRLF